MYAYGTRGTVIIVPQEHLAVYTQSMFAHGQTEGYLSNHIYIIHL